MIRRAQVLTSKRKPEKEGMLKQENHKIKFLSEKLALAAGWPRLGQERETVRRQSLTW